MTETMASVAAIRDRSYALIATDIIVVLVSPGLHVLKPAV